MPDRKYRSEWSKVPTQVRMKIKARVAATLPAPCTKCGREVARPVPPLSPLAGWDLDHIVPTHLGGSMLDPNNHGPAHPSCNRSEGARGGNLARSRSRRRLRDWS